MLNTIALTKSIHSLITLLIFIIIIIVVVVVVHLKVATIVVKGIIIILKVPNAINGQTFLLLSNLSKQWKKHQNHSCVKSYESLTICIWIS